MVLRYNVKVSSDGGSTYTAAGKAQTKGSQSSTLMKSTQLQAARRMPPCSHSPTPAVPANCDAGMLECIGIAGHCP